MLFENGRFSAVSERQGLPDSTVWSIEEDGHITASDPGGARSRYGVSTTLVHPSRLCLNMS